MVAAQCEALCLFHRAQKDGHFAQHGLLDLVRIPNTRRLEVNLHAQTAGVAMLGLYCWLLALRSHVMQAGNAPLPPVLAVVTDSGRGAREMANNVVKGAVTRMMPSWGAPFRAPTEGSHSQTMEASGAAVEEWLLSPIFEAQLPIFFPCAAYLPEIGSMPRDRSAGAPPTVWEMPSLVFASSLPPSPRIEGSLLWHFQADIMEPRCSEAFAAVKRFEQTHSLSLQTMGLSYLEVWILHPVNVVSPSRNTDSIRFPLWMQNRPELVTFALGLGSQLSLGQEVVHDAVLLMDRVASTGCTLQNDSFFLVMAACMKVAANRSREDGNLVDGKALEAATAMPASSLVRAEHDLYSILNGDTAAISALRCVQV